MQIVYDEENAPGTFAIKGRLDTLSAPTLNDFSCELYTRGQTDIVVDMAACDFISSAGLRVIISMQKRAQKKGSLVFCHVQPEVMDVIKMVGFDSILTFA